MKKYQLIKLKMESDGVFEWSPYLDFQEIDRKIAETACLVCGNIRMYDQVLNKNTYRPFSVCNTCDDVEEF